MARGPDPEPTDEADPPAALSGAPRPEMTRTPELRGLANAVAEALAGPHLDVELARAHAIARERLFGEPAAPVRIGRFIVLDRIGQGAMGVVFAAYDPELDRKVAIKVLIEHEDEGSEANRLATEARAMARLSHPNVVHVYEVGKHGGRLFIAMEFVRGVNLRQWLAGPRTLAEQLTTCLQAGRGLAAAHAAGLTHRDFKPENIIVGDDGITRVLDFGLARPTDLATTEPITAASSAGRTDAIVTASVHGTPGYIAPEVLRGAPASARSDKFSLAVTIWEALTGRLPFDGATAEARLSSTLRGRIPDDAPQPPAWIERVLRRELEGAGVATVDELINALARDPGPLRRRLAVGLIAAATVTGAYVSAASPPEAPSELTAPCTGATEILDRAWAESHRTQAMNHLAQLGDYGKVVAPRVEAAVERFASAWIEGHRDACMARERGELTDEILDRRMTCLDRDRSGLAALREVIDTAEAKELPALLLAAEGLPRPSDCGDLDRLEQQDAAIPVHAQPLAHEIARANVVYRSGRTLTLRPRVAELVATAREVGHGPLLAKALYLDGLLRIDAGDRVGAKASLREATTVAFAAGQEVIALQAWSNRVWIQATGGDRSDFPSRESIEIIETLAEQHADDPQILGVFTNLGSVALSFGRRAEGRRVLEHGAELGRRIGDRARLGLPFVLSNLVISIDDPVEKRRAHDRAVTAWTEVAGAEHPRTLLARLAGIALSDDDRWALAELQEIEATLLRLHADAKPILIRIDLARLQIADLLEERSIAHAAAQRLTENADDVGAVYDALWSGHLDRAAALAMAGVESEPVNADSPWYSHVNRGFFQLALGRAWAEANDPRAHDMLTSALAELEAGAPYDMPGGARRYLGVARRELALVAAGRRPTAATTATAAAGRAP